MVALLALGGVELATGGTSTASPTDKAQTVALVRRLPWSLWTTPTTKAPVPTTPTTKAPAPTTPTTKAPAPAPTTPTTKAPAPPTTVAPTVPAGGLSAATQNDMLAQVNARRASGTTCGGKAFPAVPALTLQGNLTNASQAYAVDMATKNYFSHTGSNGSDPGQRITAAGYRWSAWAENIAAGQTSPAAAIAGWFDSAGHCVNFMSASVTQIGFGLATSASSTYGSYWVADLGRPA